MKLSLKLMAIIGTDGFNPERKFANDIINEVD